MELPTVEISQNSDIIDISDGSNAKIYLTESATRSLLKTIIWRIVSTGVTIGISYIYLDDLGVASKLGAIDCVGKLIIHYLYERGCTKIKWGYTEISVTV
jgi:uncharacterized membrane protein